ncbi:hypothetical protein L202_07017 [Cryptococcus amylolentus CBS 6039]|uniref:G-patch domain-containing protein n=1 Tax=Cryptococcus amylolentus CBS 6039 TaxID=1295533 RepID=A0A1E3HG06_9TREE|nr:hypothetical protein L202_07017 [Cryptococcus amylolentus CBS 6039]ODN74686.1 hypothetical protein L202_07017 [Cryptococcus amylolentus CBS 6039]
MPRRKNAYLEDGSDSDASISGQSDGAYDSQEDGDYKAERRLFEFKSNKRRRTDGRSGKEDAWEGIFGEGDEDVGGRGGRGGIGGRGRKPGASSSRTDWTKAPTFVSNGKKTAEEDELQALERQEHAEEEAAQRASSSGSDSSSDSESGGAEELKPPSPRVREEEEEEEAPRRGMGLGFGRAPATATNLDEAPRGGLGARGAAVNPVDSPKPINTPSTFGRPPPSLTSTSGPPRAQRSFLPKAPEPSAVKQVDLTAHERAHFSKIKSSFGAKLLAKQGWEVGKGLGKDEDGRAVPIEVGKVFKGQGIQSGMRTEDSKREARRKGELSDEEEEDVGPSRRRGRAPKAPKEKKQDNQGWKREKKVKVKVEHKTYEQLLAEAGDGSVTQPGIGLVLDARGGDLKEVQSLSSLSLSNWAPTSETTRLPELRHNLRLILEHTNGEVTGMVKEGKVVQEKRRWALREEERSRAKSERAEKELFRLQQIQQLVQNINDIATQQTATDSPSLDPLQANFNTLINSYKDEYKTLGLDDVVVGAIGQVLRDEWAEWQPLSVSSDVLLTSLKTWRKAYNLPTRTNDADLAVTYDENGWEVEKKKEENGGRMMTAWEALLWASWTPKVRSAINNDWEPSRPDKAVHLLESWQPILPQFILDNVLDQLVLPKVKAAVEQWDSRRGKSAGSLSTIVFPWLPLLGSERVKDVVDLAKRRIRSVLRNWAVKDGVPDELTQWRRAKMYPTSEWDKLILQFVLPKLGACLRDDFAINPRKQDMVPLQDWVLPWHTLIRQSNFAHLLEAEFFPKWLDILYIWLIQPSCKHNEVASWFTWWKERFPQAVLDIPGVAHGFDNGIQLMSEAVGLGADAPSKLQKPVFKPLPHKSSKASKAPKAKPAPAVAGANIVPDITFRSIAEDYAVQNDLIFMPIGRSHDKTGKPLFKVCKGVDGRGGVTVYIGENAVFAHMEDGEYRAVSLDDMVKRASR